MPLNPSTHNEIMFEYVDVPTKRLSDDARIPEYAHEGDAGLDLRSTEALVLKPFARALVSTGIAVAIPDGYAGFVVPRSGLAAKHGISIVNAPGLIDSNYRGEIKVALMNLDASNEFHIEQGDRIAQLVIMGVPPVRLNECERLDDTARGEQGFGSSGVS